MNGSLCLCLRVVNTEEPMGSTYKGPRSTTTQKNTLMLIYFAARHSTKYHILEYRGSSVPGDASIRSVIQLVCVAWGNFQKCFRIPQRVDDSDFPSMQHAGRSTSRFLPSSVRSTCSICGFSHRNNSHTVLTQHRSDLQIVSSLFWFFGLRRDCIGSPRD